MLSSLLLFAASVVNAKESKAISAIEIVQESIVILVTVMFMFTDTRRLTSGEMSTFERQ